jgi:putative SOS response-associated peptidase YedK
MNRPMASSAVEGYYEWQKTEDGKKIPNYLYSEKEDVLVFAGCMSSGRTRPFPRMTRTGGA